MDYNSVINFWFNEFEAKQWWVKDPDFDQLIRQRFAETHAAAQAGELSDWREDDLGRLVGQHAADLVPGRLGLVGDDGDLAVEDLVEQG